MRLTEKQVQAIREIFKRHFMNEDAIWLFGSRADDSKRGGDIDLYIETNYTDLDIVLKKRRVFLVDLILVIGDQKIDVVINRLSAKQKLPIYEEARNTGVKLI